MVFQTFLPFYSNFHYRSTYILSIQSIIARSYSKPSIVSVHPRGTREMYNNSWNVTQDDARVPSRWKAFSKGSAFLRPTSHFFLSFRPVCMERGNGSRGLKKRKKKKKIQERYNLSTKKADECRYKSDIYETQLRQPLLTRSIHYWGSTSHYCMPRTKGKGADEARFHREQRQFERVVALERIESRTN